MADPIQPTPATPALSPADLVSQQQQKAQAQKTIANQDQQKLQQKAEKGIFKRIQNKTIQRGSMIIFQYSLYKHDPFPLCLVGKTQGKPGENWPLGMIAGINLHYLTFRYMKYLTNMFCGKVFHYGMIKGNNYIVNSYRSYKKEGRKQVKMLDCDFMNTVLKTARSFKPSEVEAMRQQIQKQLQERMHPTAEQVAKEYQESIYKQSHKDYNIGKEQAHGSFNPTNVIEPE